jgi:hypothetical protein
MKSDVLTELFGKNAEGLHTWISSGEQSEPSAISEYDSYGEWIVKNQPRKIRFSKWNNLAVNLELNKIGDYKELKRKYGKYNSISAHSYLS